MNANNEYNTISYIRISILIMYKHVPIPNNKIPGSIYEILQS